MAVNRTAEDGDGLVLGCIRTPDLVFLNEPTNVLPPNGAMERAEKHDIQPSRLFQQRLHLGTVLAHDVGVIPAGVIQPVPLEIQLAGKNIAAESAKGTEGIGGKQDLIRRVISHHDFRPVDHGSHQERKCMASGVQRVALLDCHRTVGNVAVKKLADHGNGLGVAHDLRLGIGLQDLHQGSGVIWLHVVHHHIIQGTSLKSKSQVLQEPVPHRLIGGIHQDGFFIFHKIGIVADAPWDREYVFKKGQSPVGDTQIQNILSNILYAVHNDLSFAVSPLSRLDSCNYADYQSISETSVRQEFFALSTAK